MNILMMTNTFTPHVGGVARSVAEFTRSHRLLGHQVLVVAPEFPGAPEPEPGVVRVPALQQFNGTDFSIPLPIPGYLDEALNAFAPDVVHAHHPFLLGDTALRVAAWRHLPVVFTHHTQYEKYTHYVPGDSPILQRFVIELSIGYANLVDGVIAPSASIARQLVEQGVTAPVHVIPTGIDLDAFRPGDRSAARRALGLPESAFVVGHVGRLAPEKNLAFLTRAVARTLSRNPAARFLLVGAGPSQDEVRSVLTNAGLAGQLTATGTLVGPALLAAYQAMDVFAFASHTETQGLVLTEALACGVPAVAVDADGAREVVEDGVNGRLLQGDDEEAFAAALDGLIGLPPAARMVLAAAARASSLPFSLVIAAEQALHLYGSLAATTREEPEASLWGASVARIRSELAILTNVAGSASQALFAAEEKERAA